jgi:hypothetical protein
MATLFVFSASAHASEDADRVTGAYSGALGGSGNGSTPGISSAKHDFSAGSRSGKIPLFRSSCSSMKYSVVKYSACASGPESPGTPKRRFKAVSPDDGESPLPADIHHTQTILFSIWIAQPASLRLPCSPEVDGDQVQEPEPEDIFDCEPKPPRYRDFAAGCRERPPQWRAFPVR